MTHNIVYGAPIAIIKHTYVFRDVIVILCYDVIMYL